MTRKARHTSHSEKDYYKRNAFYINTPNLKVWHLWERCVCCYVQEMGAKKRFKRRKKLLYPGLWKELFAQFRTEKKCCSKKDEETTFFYGKSAFFHRARETSFLERARFFFFSTNLLRMILWGKMPFFFCFRSSPLSRRGGTLFSSSAWLNGRKMLF